MFFIMINHPNGKIMPMMEDDDWIATFQTLKLAQLSASDNGMCQAYGYEVFECGRGEN